MATWDLTALVNAADPKASLAERHLWMARLMEWLREAPLARDVRDVRDAHEARDETRTPLPVLRLKLLLAQIDAQPALRERVQALLARFWSEIDAVALFADFGFGPRLSLARELARRIALQWLPATPETRNLTELFQLLFQPGDGAWLDAIDPPTMARVAALVAPPGVAWRRLMSDAIGVLASEVHSAGHTSALRDRMARSAGADPFRALVVGAEQLRRAVVDHEGDALHAAQLLRAQMDACRRAALTVTAHLEQYGVSVDIVFEQDQLLGRLERIDALLACVVSRAPLPEIRHLVVRLLREAGEQRELRALMARHYELLARQVAERNAETGEHYITTDRASYQAMLGAAAGGGAVIAGTTFLKFAVAALGMTVFWTGFWSGVNYAASFVLIMLLHWTVATKQPAMTAPAMAATLDGRLDDARIELFVDRVAQLIRSQMAGIIGNLLVCGPLVLLVQWAWQAAFGRTLVGPDSAHHVLHALTLLGPTALFAAFTGVLLFTSSLIAGWAENWFVFHRLDSAIAWNPRIVSLLGAPRAAFWAGWWRRNVSGLAANISLGLMLGLVPALASILALPLEVRHVTLSTGQIAAAAAALGPAVLHEAAFWWCVAAVGVTGVLNLSVSFWLAFKVALRSRGLQLRERRRIAAALRRRLFTQPLSFVRPPR